MVQQCVFSLRLLDAGSAIRGLFAEAKGRNRCGALRIAVPLLRALPGLASGARTLKRVEGGFATEKSGLADVRIPSRSVAGVGARASLPLGLLLALGLFRRRSTARVRR